MPGMEDNLVSVRYMVDDVQAASDPVELFQPAGG
jgi:hypothetical protein